MKIRSVMPAALVALALATAFACAGGTSGTSPAPTPADAKKFLDEGNETMKRLKTQQPANAKNDPWSGVRPASDGAAKR